MLLVCDATAAAAASPPASASLPSCSAISRTPRSAAVYPLFPWSLVGRGASLFNHRAILQLVEGAGGETLTTIDELRACGCRFPSSALSLLQAAVSSRGGGGAGRGRESAEQGAGRGAAAAAAEQGEGRRPRCWRGRARRWGGGRRTGVRGENPLIP